MKKSFLIALASIFTLGLSNPAEAFYCAPYGYYDAVVITPGPFGYLRPVSVYPAYPAYPVYVEMDPKAALFSAGVSASMVSLFLGVCGVAQVAEGLADFAKGYISAGNDGAEFPRGVLTVAGATLIGAVAVAAIQSATN